MGLPAEPIVLERFALNWITSSVHDQINESRSPRGRLRLAGPELPLHRLPQFLVRHVQIPLGRLEIRVTQQKLNRPKIQAARQPAAGGLMPEVVPVQIDVRELLAIDPPTRPG